MNDQRFDIRQLLGEGGTARVYRAWDRSHRREVALKIPFRDAIPPDRLARETTAATRLVHPHIVRTWELVDTPEGPALVMELVQGESLRARLDREGRLSVQDTASLLGQVLSALEYAHANGVVHRDLCPRNLLLEGGHARLSDFGLARVQEEHTLTQTREIMGSVKYFAPEQATGGRIGPPADLYAVGVMGFEMLAGRAPFEGDNPVQVALKHLNEAPPSVSAIRSDVPGELDAVLRRAMAKEPSERFADAADMARALRNATEMDRTMTRPPGWLTPEKLAPAAAVAAPVAARAMATPPRAPELVGTHRRFSVMPLVALLLLLFGGLGLMVAAGGRDDEPEVERTSYVRRIPTPTQQATTRRVERIEAPLAPAPMEVLEPAVAAPPAAGGTAAERAAQIAEQAREMSEKAREQPAAPAGEQAERAREREERQAEQAREREERQAEKAREREEKQAEKADAPPPEETVVEPPPEEQADVAPPPEEAPVPVPVDEFTPDPAPPLPDETYLPSQPSQPQPDVTFTPSLRGDAGPPTEAAQARSPNTPR